MCRARQELSNGAFLAKFGIDTAENELPKVSMKRGVPDRSCTPHAILKLAIAGEVDAGGS